MNDRELASEVAERVLLLESLVEALKQAILNQPNAPTRERLDTELFQAESRIRTSQKHREQSDGFRLLIQAQDDPATLLRLLHDHVLYQAAV